MTDTIPRIAYLLQTFPCASETFILREMAALVDQGVDLKIYALQAQADTPFVPEVLDLLPRVVYSDAVQPLAVFNSLVCHPGRTLTSLHRSRLGCARSLRCLPPAAYFAADARAEGVRHVHAHFAGLPAEIALVMSHLLGVPYSVSVHAWDIYAQSPGRVLRSVEQAAFVAACTQAGHDRILSTCPSLEADRVQVIRHGVAVVEAKSPAPARGRAILAAGRLIEKKGFCHLVDACSELVERFPDLECVIVGDGPQREALEDQVARLGLAVHIRLPGWLPPAELDTLYASCAVLAAPSIIASDGDRDGLPNVILEAMSHGLAVIGSDLSGIPEAITDGKNGHLVPPGDARALADRLADLLADTSLQHAMGQAGLSRVEQDFDLQKNVIPLAALFAKDQTL